MLRTVSEERTLWDAILPESCLTLPAGLAEVDHLLDDPGFFEPFRPFFSARFGRPSIPMETYLRLMFLRFATGSASRRCAPRWPTPWPGAGSAASLSGPRCRTPPRS